MRLSEKVEQAVYCCILLADLPEDEALTSSQLASLFGFPKAYLAKSMQALSNAGILNARPGRAGGYRLAQLASKITLRDIVIAVENSTPGYTPRKDPSRGSTAQCSTHYTWTSDVVQAIQAADTLWLAELGKTTLTELVERRQASRAELN